MILFYYSREVCNSHATQLYNFFNLWIICIKKAVPVKVLFKIFRIFFNFWKWLRKLNFFAEKYKNLLRALLRGTNVQKIVKKFLHLLFWNSGPCSKNIFMLKISRVMRGKKKLGKIRNFVKKKDKEENLKPRQLQKMCYQSWNQWL